MTSSSVGAGRSSVADQRPEEEAEVTAAQLDVGRGRRGNEEDVKGGGGRRKGGGGEVVGEAERGSQEGKGEGKKEEEEGEGEGEGEGREVGGEDTMTSEVVRKFQQQLEEIKEAPR